MSTSRSDHFATRWLLKWAIAGLATVCCALSARAVDPNRTLSQYLHDAWITENGFPGGTVSSFAQTPDGYLWIGTDKGLIRFDGFTFRKFEQASPSSFPIGAVRKLLTDAQGNMWILLQNTKLLHYHDGVFDLSRGEAENGITALGQKRGGGVLVSSLAMGTLTYSGDRFVSVSPQREAAAGGNEITPDDLSTRLSWSTGLTPHSVATANDAVISMVEATDGKIWLGTEEGGLFYLGESRVYAVAPRLLAARVSCLLTLEKSELWVGTSKGLLRWNGTELTRTDVPAALRDVAVLSMIRDRDANIWVGTTRGLQRLNLSGISPSLGNTLSDVAVTALFEDREGNIWIGSERGIERLRESAFVTYQVPDLKSQSIGPLFAAVDGSVWFAPIQGGLRRLKGGDVGTLGLAGLGKDVIYSIAGQGDDLWLGRQRGGLTRLGSVNGLLTTKTYTQTDGLAQNSISAVFVSRDGTLWAGTLSSGVSALRNGRFTNYTTADGLASNTISSIEESIDGTMWFGTPNGVSALSKSGWRSFGTRDGLSSQDVHSLLFDSAGVLWIGTAEGIAFLSAGRIQVPRNAPGSLHEQIYGLAEDKGGWLWLATVSHMLQVKRNSLIEDRVGDKDLRDYGLADGLRGTEGVKRHQSVVADSKGRIWFATNRGVSVADPVRVSINSAPALVRIEEVVADGSALTLGETIRIPAAKQRTTFRYAGLSLGNPERIRYRYRLDGFDHGWNEPVTNREATYANLGAGTYRFRVMASNSDGLWNGSEAALAFEVQPTVWQTWWFRLSCVACAGLVTLLVYRLRVHQVTRLLNVRFEERLAERTRIAQELHDTFLQGVVSVSMQLHVAADQLPDDSPVRASLNRILQLTGRVIEEGRNTLRGLRASIDSAHDLKNSFSRVPQELGREEGTGFRVVVEGISLPVRPTIRDDVYGIGREALVNAFRHSGASNIAMYLEYAADQLRITVQDDGRGIDPKILHFGRDGHWGLSGMRERAERIGGKLRVLTRQGGGTEVELRLPGNVAFESNSLSRASKWFTIFGWKQKRS